MGSKLNDLTIDHEPIGTASLAQVHRATRKSDGLELVLKIQYPGVANAIDSDMSLFKTCLSLHVWFLKLVSLISGSMKYVK